MRLLVLQFNSLETLHQRCLNFKLERQEVVIMLEFTLELLQVENLFLMFKNWEV